MTTTPPEAPAQPAALPAEVQAQLDATVASLNTQLAAARAELAAAVAKPARFAIWDKAFEKFGPFTYATKAEAQKAAKTLEAETGAREFATVEIREV